MSVEPISSDEEVDNEAPVISVGSELAGNESTAPPVTTLTVTTLPVDTTLAAATTVPAATSTSTSTTVVPTSTPAPLAPLLAVGNTISGRVSDEFDDRPVVGADVGCYTPAGAPIQFQVRTGSDGRFVFADVPDGSYKVNFHAQWVGYDNEYWENKIARRVRGRNDRRFPPDRPPSC